MRIWCLSDIHVDYPENRRWVSELERDTFCHDILILAGDITHKEALFVECLSTLVECFWRVFFIPGNHDIWLDGDDFGDSLSKFDQRLELARSLGVETDSNIIEPNPSDSYFGLNQIIIAPIFSWYDFSFGEPGDELRATWMDFKNCRWPNSYGTLEVSNWMQEQANTRIDRIIDRLSPDTQVISFSHFLPRIDLMPTYIPEKYRYIYPVLGGNWVDKALRRLNAGTHIYGHSHVNQDIELDGVRYINNAFGYVGETAICRKQLLKVCEY